MKRISLALVAVVALLVLTAPIVLADHNPPPAPPQPDCGDQGCR
jgi:hypothetical protein